MSVGRLCRTVRHLKASQIVGQLKHRIGQRFESIEKYTKHNAGSFPGVMLSSANNVPLPQVGRNTLTDLLNGRFVFINQSHELNWPPQWDSEEPELLWQYNLHYFEYLWLLPFEEAQELVADWIDKHTLSHRHVGWHSYPVSLRLMNWIGYFFVTHQDQTLQRLEFTRKLWASINLQARWLENHLEKHLLGNHYWENGVAMAYVGACFKGEDAAGWRNLGFRIIRDQIDEQILRDGVHFELSPMYHCRVLYTLKLLISTGNQEFVDFLRPYQKKMQCALSYLVHPDQEIALLNDSAFGIYPSAKDMDVVASPDGNFELPSAGYYGARANGDYVICDAGAIGPDYIPGHAHADIFSYELSMFGQRVVVDAGNFDYRLTESRQYSRSTSAHNTVEINGRDQCEMWGAFRVGNRRYPSDVVLQKKDDGFALAGTLRGYESAEHCRRFRWYDDGLLMVDDIVSGLNDKTAISRVHLHPSVDVIEQTDQSVVLRLPNQELVYFMTSCDKLILRDSMYYPEFGKAIENKVIEQHLGGTNSSCRYCLNKMMPIKVVNDKFVELSDGRQYEW